MPARFRRSTIRRTSTDAQPYRQDTLGKYAHVFRTDIKWTGRLAETVRAVLPSAAAYQPPELSRAELRDVVIPTLARRVESGVTLYREGEPLPNLQDVRSLAHDLTALAALVQWAATQSVDLAERVKWP